MFALLVAHPQHLVAVELAIADRLSVVAKVDEPSLLSMRPVKVNM